MQVVKDVHHPDPEGDPESISGDRFHLIWHISHAGRPAGQRQEDVVRGRNDQNTWQTEEA